MARPSLTVVGEADRVLAEEVARAEALGRKLVEVAKSGGSYFVVMDLNSADESHYLGDLLEIAALTEEVAREAKLAALGLG